MFGQSTVALRGPWNPTDLVKIGPTAEGPRRALRVPPRLPRKRARPRLRLRAVGAAPDDGSRARGLRARRHRPRLPGQARAAVLVLLPLQRLQQHARGRLGDDPARLRRARCRRGARGGASRRGRLQLARGRRAGGLGRGQARDRRRHAPGRLPGRRLAREQVHGGALPRQLRGRRRRLRRHAGAAPRAPAGGADDPERPGGRGRRVPVDHVRGALGRAPEGVLQRPDRPEPEGAVDGADRVGRRAGATAATPFRRAGCSGRARPTSSAPASSAAPRPSPSCS